MNIRYEFQATSWKPHGLKLEREGWQCRLVIETHAGELWKDFLATAKTRSHAMAVAQERALEEMASMAHDESQAADRFRDVWLQRFPREPWP